MVTKSVSLLLAISPGLKSYLFRENATPEASDIITRGNFQLVKSMVLVSPSPADWERPSLVALKKIFTADGNAPTRMSKPPRRMNHGTDPR